MTPEQIELVQSSFAKVEPIAEAAGKMFYDRLFEIDPDLRPMFPDEIEPQIKKLMAMIKVAVNGLTKLESIVPAVQDMGRRHAAYGVITEHYETVGEALLWTLEEGLGAAFTDEVKQAWTDCYALLTCTMLEAAAAEAAD